MAEDEPHDVGQEMYRWATELFPLCRSLTGPGTLETLEYFQALIPGLEIHSIPSGTQVGDWVVPDEWRIRDAFIKDASGQRVVDFNESNLHVIGYSEPVDRVLGLEELQPHLRSLPHLPDAIPYVTSYYDRYWGFCLSHERRQAFTPGDYHVHIDSSLEPGHLHYADLLIPGETEEEILLSSYCCHPSLANNELSGPVVLAALARWLLALPKRRYSYRIVFTVETIGSIVYIHEHLEALRRNVKAGYVLTCCGDNNRYSFSQSRLGDSIADRAARQVLKFHAGEFQEYRFLEIGGSDNIQYCSPNLDLPVCTVMRSAHGTYREYHNSLDDLEFISAAGLQGAFDAYCKILSTLEGNVRWRLQTVGEPQLGKRGLYSSAARPMPWQRVKLQKMFLAYADGAHDILDMSERFDCDPAELLSIAADLAAHDLIRVSA